MQLVMTMVGGLAGLVLLAATPARAEPIEVTGAGASRDLTCTPADEVNITGSGHVLTVRGDCRTLAIHGKGHRVQFETAGQVFVNGIEHDVRGQASGGLEITGKGSQVRTAIRGPAPADGSRPVIQVRGVAQVVELALETPIRLEVSGADNRVEWVTAAGVAEPALEVRGVKQTVRRK